MCGLRNSETDIKRCERCDVRNRNNYNMLSGGIAWYTVTGIVAREVCDKRRVAKAGFTATLCVVSIKSYCDWTLLVWYHVGNNQVATEYTNNLLQLNYF